MLSLDRSEFETPTVLLLAATYAVWALGTLIWEQSAVFAVLLTGVAEILGAIGLVQPFSRPLRQAAGWGLALYALCVWPANINHFAMDMARADGGLGLGYHVPRMFAQPVIIWLALWVGECWPLRRRPMPPGA